MQTRFIHIQLKTRDITMICNLATRPTGNNLGIVHAKSIPQKNCRDIFCIMLSNNIFALRCLLLVLATFPVIVSAESSVPEWTKYPFFFVGAALIASIGWFLACCCCLPCGCTGKLTILVISAGCIGVYAYFLFGPWYTDIL